MLEDLAARIAEKSRAVARLRREIAKAVVGQTVFVDRLLAGLFTRGHVLIEGVPGLAKTLTVKALATALRLEFKRVQFTPDLLPADLVGTEIYDAARGVFSVKKGPLFHNLILADEINRAPSKVQSALLEAMQEGQITIGGQTFPLPRPFLVMATQNPIEQEGVYPLPEAQVDRFMLKLRVDYPSREEEREIVRRRRELERAVLAPVLDPEELDEIRELVDEVRLDERILDYILDVTAASRRPGDYGLWDLAPLIEFGASPRAAIALSQAARALAFLQGRAYVTPHDVKTIAPDVLRHRLVTTFEAEAEDVTPDDLVARIFNAVEAP